MKNDRLWIRRHTDGLGDGEAWKNTGGATEALAGAIVTKYDIPAAEPKTSSVDVPGMNGVLDFSEVNGLFFKNRTITISVALTEAATFNFEGFKSVYLGRVVDIMVDIDPDLDGLQSILPYYTGRLSIKNDNGREQLREFDLVLDADPFMYTFVNSVESKNKENLAQVTEAAPVAHSASGATYERFPASQKIAVYGDDPGDSVIFKISVTNGWWYTFGAQIQGGEYTVQDSEGNDLGYYFIAPESYVYIKITTDATVRELIAIDDGGVTNYVEKYIATLTIPTLLFGGTSWEAGDKTDVPEMTATEGSRLIFNGKIVIISAGTRYDPACVIRPGENTMASTNASGLGSGKITIRHRIAIL